MPYTIIGEPNSWNSIDYREKHDYKYPEGLDLRPTSNLHKSLRTKIWQRANIARNEMKKRFPSWKKIDKTLTVYMPADEYEEQLKQEDDRKPISIIFPYSYSMLEALLTYTAMAFFQDPMFRYEGVDDEDVSGSMLLELIVKMHCIKNKVALNVHTVLRDNFCYGIGIGSPGWTVKRGMKPIKSKSVIDSALGQRETDYVDFVEDILFEGNELNNIDPYMFLPDPSVSSNDYQKGEFVGWIDRTNYMDLLSEENTVDSGLFNVKYLQNKKDRRSTMSLDESARQDKFGKSDTAVSGILNPVDRIRLYVKIIPKEWEVSDVETPEIWYFELASDDVIIACEKATHNHGMFPIGVASSEFDGYSSTPVSRMEILDGLQHTLDFLFNSHVANVRKAINDMLIVDPYLVNINDLKNPEPGKLIRLRRPAWGRGVDKVVQQLGVQDITRANIADSAYITQWMDRVSGADQSMQGALRQGGPERLTGAEFQGTRGSAISRLQRIAMVIGMQFMQDIGTMFAVHTQQYMSQPAVVKLAGPTMEQLKSQFGIDKDRVRVNPSDIYINYDTIVRDGSIPGGNFSQAWLDLFKTVTTNEQLVQEFDVFRMFSYIATELGAKNIEDFRRKTNNMNTMTAPDDAVAAEAAKGNLVPMGGM